MTFDDFHIHHFDRYLPNMKVISQGASATFHPTHNPQLSSNDARQFISNRLRLTDNIHSITIDRHQTSQNFFHRCTSPRINYLGYIVTLINSFVLVDLPRNFPPTDNLRLMSSSLTITHLKHKLQVNFGLHECFFWNPHT